MHEHALGQRRSLAGDDLVVGPVDGHHHAHGAGLRIDLIVHAHELRLPFGHGIAEIQPHQRIESRELRAAAR